MSFRCDLLLDDVVMVVMDGRPQPLDRELVVDTVIEAREHAVAQRTPLLLVFESAEVEALADLFEELSQLWLTSGVDLQFRDRSPASA